MHTTATLNGLWWAHTDKTLAELEQHEVTLKVGNEARSYTLRWLAERYIPRWDDLTEAQRAKGIARVAPKTTTQQAPPAPNNAELAEFSRAFNLFAELDDAKGEASRLRTAAAKSTGSERKSNLQQAHVLEAEAGRIEAELNGAPPPVEAVTKLDYVKPGRNRSVAPDRLTEILDALDEFAAANRHNFDRRIMPGPLGKSADRNVSMILRHPGTLI